MVQQYIHLVCDHCGAPWPTLEGFSEAAALQEAAIFSARSLREDAKRNGWTHKVIADFHGTMHRRDLCAACTAKHAAQKKEAA